MDIINDTRINFITKNFNEMLYLVTQVFYDLSPDVSINKALTYGQVITDEILECESAGSMLFYAHELNENQIRDFRLEHQSKTYSASNAQSFMSFVKDHFGIKKSEPQTIAKLQVPQLNPDIQFQCGFVKTPAVSFKLKPLPWEVIQNHHYRKQMITPFIHTMNYFVKQKTLTTLLFYPVSQQGYITINQGAPDVTE